MFFDYLKSFKMCKKNRRIGSIVGVKMVLSKDMGSVIYDWSFCFIEKKGG